MTRSASYRFLATAVVGIATAAVASPSHATKSLTNLNRVQSCAPLSGGQLLIATLGGLALIGKDGSTQRTWTRSDGLLGTRVYLLQPASATSYWVGTEKGLHEISVAKGGTLKLLKTIPGKAIRAVANHAGQTYVGTWGAGVMRLQKNQLVALKMPRADDRGPSRITSLSSHGGVLFAGTAGAGLLRLVGDSFVATATKKLPSAFVWSLASAKEQLWIGTLGGLVVRDKNRSFKTMSTVDARALLVNESGGVVIGAYGARGLLDKHSRRVETLGSMPVFVNRLTQAHGSLCVATRRGVLRRGTKDKGLKRIALKGPPSNDVSAILATTDGLLVGTFDQGLSRYSAGRFRRLAGLPRSLRINALAQSGNKTIWAATPRGLYRIAPSGKVRIFGKEDGLPNVDVHALMLLDEKTIVAGTGRGAIIVSGDRVQTIGPKQGLPVAAVWAIAAGKDKTLYFGTSHGLYHWSKAYRRGFRRLCVASGHLKDDWVTAIEKDGDSLYVGTYNAGVSKLTPSANGELAATHLGGGWVNFGGLTVAKGALWAATMTGLRRLMLKPKKAKTATTPTIKVENSADWIEVDRAAPGKDVTQTTLTKSGGLWIASRRGIARFPKVAFTKPPLLREASSLRTLDPKTVARRLH